MKVTTLTGRGAVITGGSSGIGEAIAKTLARKDVRVVVTSRSPEALTPVREGIRRAGGEASAIRADVTELADVRRLGDEARTALGAVDLLVHSAGAASSLPFVKLTLADWEEMLRSNATSAFLVVKEFLPGMIERGWGRIVIVTSIAGLEGARYVSHYSAAKHAVVGMVRSLALELEGSGVTVNAVCPGYVETPMTDRTLENVRSRAGMSRDEALAAILATSGQSRLLAPEEVAECVLDLCRIDAAARNGEAVRLLPGEPSN